MTDNNTKPLPQQAPNVSIVDGRPTTTSMDIAAFFDKRHKDVLRAVRNLLRSDDEARRNFAPGSRPDANGQLRACFTADRTGFVMLAMGFTGANAVRWRRRYIEAFDAMEAELTHRHDPAPYQFKLRDRRDALMKALIAETHPARRETLYEDLHAACQCLGANTLALSDLQSPQRLRQPADLVNFWRAVDELVGPGKLLLNHSPRPGVAAFNLKEVCAIADARGYKLPARKVLLNTLRDSGEPLFLASNHNTRSALCRRTIRCWLFKTHEYDHPGPIDETAYSRQRRQSQGEQHSH